jgi:peptide deformylase
MSILKVARMGHPVLRRKARAVSSEEIGTSAFQRLVEDMIETMREYSGVGLAAPQVHEDLRLFVAALGDGEDQEAGDALVLVNPEIQPVGEDEIEDWEGCLSIPDLRGLVPRADAIQVRALGRDGRPMQLRATGFSARVIQHETDHLDGVLFLDRMRSFESLCFLEEYSRFWGKDTPPAE